MGLLYFFFFFFSSGNGLLGFDKSNHYSSGTIYHSKIFHFFCFIMNNMNKKLFVGNLDFDVKDIELEELFKTVAKVLTAEIVRFFDKKSKGFGFVEMETVEEAQKAVEKLNETDFRGRKIIVSYARLPQSPLTK